jgi:hypothetical protein
MSLRRCPRAGLIERCPCTTGAGVVLEDGTGFNARTVICNADPKIAMRLLEGQDVPQEYRDRIDAWKIRSPVVKFNAALSASERSTSGRATTRRRRGGL